MQKLQSFGIAMAIFCLLFLVNSSHAIEFEYIGPSSGSLNYGFTGDTLNGQELFTQLMPNITLETQVLWSPDSKYIYVLDRTGIWRLQLGSVLFPLWTQVVKKMDISRFEVSASGKALIYETALNPELKTSDFLIQFEDQIYGAPDPYRLFYDIWMVDLSPLAAKKVPSPIQKKHMSAGGPTWMPDAHNNLSPRLITRGLHATFNPVGQTIEVSTLDGQYGILIETMKFSSCHSTGRLYD